MYVRKLCVRNRANIFFFFRDEVGRCKYLGQSGNSETEVLMILIMFSVASAKTQK